MEQTVVKATTGRDLGSRPSRRLRNAGELPGVVYGLGKDPVSVSVNYAELRDALKTDMGLNTIIKLDVEGGEPETVIVRAVQRDPIKRRVTHADFIRVKEGHQVKVRVPIHTVGEATAVTSQGALVEQKRFQLEIKAAPETLPTALEADLSMLRLDRRITVGDLQLPEGATTLVDPKVSVVAPVISRAARMAAREAEQAQESV